MKWHRGSSQREWGELISKMAEEMEEDAWVWEVVLEVWNLTETSKIILWVVYSQEVVI